jgi:hypothetical protein
VPLRQRTLEAVAALSEGTGTIPMRLPWRRATTYAPAVATMGASFSVAYRWFPDTQDGRDIQTVQDS